MNPIEKQQEVITSLYNLIRMSVQESYTKAVCRFEYCVEEDGSSSVETEFEYFNSGKQVSSYLAYDKELKPIRLVPQLHALMKEHTGGSWTVFTLTIEQDGKIKTSFEYPDKG